MNKDGFVADVRIDRFEVCSGLFNNAPYGAFEMEMSGYIRHDSSSGVELFDNHRDTFAHVYLIFSDSPDCTEYSVDNVANIGTLSVRESETSVAAYIRATLESSCVSSILSYRGGLITLEPIFFRKNKERKHYFEESEDYGIMKYIQRIYFEQHFDSGET